MGAETNLTELDALLEFLQAISRTPMLQDNPPEFPSMVCIGHPFIVRLVCSIRQYISIFNPDDPSSIAFCPIS
jgi:hypothetical protein